MCHQRNEQIRYLAKFVSKYDYVQTFIDNGTLYANPASYFVYSDRAGQGDIREGALSHKHMIYKNYNLPLYCMMALYDNNFKDGKLLIDKRIIKDFNCENGFLILINPQPFIETFANYFNKRDIGITFGTVNYYYFKNEPKMFAKYANDKTNSHFFIKTPNYSYQQEYRIVICDPCSPCEYVKLKELGITVPTGNYEHKEYKICNNMHSFSKVIPIKSSRSKIEDNNNVIDDDLWSQNG